jgi:hypothetical protein
VHVWFVRTNLEVQIATQFAKILFVYDEVLPGFGAAAGI